MAEAACIWTSCACCTQEHAVDLALEDLWAVGFHGLLAVFGGEAETLGRFCANLGEEGLDLGLEDGLVDGLCVLECVGLGLHLVGPALCGVDLFRIDSRAAETSLRWFSVMDSRAEDIFGFRGDGRVFCGWGRHTGRIAGHDVVVHSGVNRFIQANAGW